MKEEYMYMGIIPTQIYKLLWKNNRMTRDELLEKLNKPRTTIYDNLKRMTERGIVENESEEQYAMFKEYNKRGRPKVYWRLTQTFITDMESVLDGKN